MTGWLISTMIIYIYIYMYNFNINKFYNKKLCLNVFGHMDL